MYAEYILILHLYISILLLIRFYAENFFSFSLVYIVIEYPIGYFQIPLSTIFYERFLPFPAVVCFISYSNFAIISFIHLLRFHD